jgi:hypothetical protein
MSIFKKIFITFVLAILVIPASVSAAWFWDKPAAKTSAPTNNQISDLTPAEKEAANNKYKIWSDSFEKGNIQSVIDNQNNFSFSIAELNYLFNSENSKIKNPLLSNFKLTNNNELLSVSADFKKIIIRLP